ncbi:KGK family protein [Gloeocapsa sp. PCC 7428]|uniref:KGK domain-containing protein n=1 Tax=Gloeocapsa sp. PCC 7428 TaxID=1173026 RepID=UPI0002A5FB0A|nr:KGK domain-containing protein [Gloeocapsa sp. PCC 7428]AFZ29014.1 KGK family protein [Gloeocapsa sp. PCC 7428]
MNNRFKTLDSDFANKDSVVSFTHSIFKIGELASFLNVILRDIGIKELYNRLVRDGKGQIPLDKNNEWIDSGKSCEILVPGTKGWQKGTLRIKVALEFCPDTLEIEEISPKDNKQTSSNEQMLDELRAQIKQIN